MDREFFVYVNIKNVPILVGRLWARVRSDRASATLSPCFPMRDAEPSLCACEIFWNAHLFKF
jgi:hypothetical protein